MGIFSISFHRTMDEEGGYSNLPSDRGGRTYKGISEKIWPNWPGWVIITKYEPLQQYQIIKSDALDRMVEDFYLANFWNPLRLSQVKSQDICDELFDTGVNMGNRTAAQFLQQALNLLNRNQKDFPDLKVDGDLGANTLSIVNKFTNIQALRKALNGFQFCRYREICINDPGQELNFIGWLKRVNY